MNLFCIYSVRLSRVRLFVTPWTVTRQAPLSMEFSRQEYWSRWPFPTPGDLPSPGIEPTSPMSPALADGFFTTSAWKALEGNRRRRVLFLPSQYGRSLSFILLNRPG